MPRVFHYDFPELRIGTAEYPAGPTGCTVFRFPEGSVGAVDVRGGAAATREESSLVPASADGGVDALFIAGGSTYGLDVGSGVMAELERTGRGGTAWERIPAVPGAVVYDFARRRNAVHPDARLGVRAFRAARRNRVHVGRAGAGVNVTVGSYWGDAYAEPGGQGAAFIDVRGMRLLALAVVNAAGNVVGLDGAIVAGSRDPITGERYGVAELLLENAGWRAPTPKGNTTVTVVVTNVLLDAPELARLAVMTHSALARVIEPVHTPYDGDTLFAVSTRSARRRKGWEVADLGTLAGRLVQDAVLDAVSG